MSRCSHGRELCALCVVITDDAKRMHYGINMAIVSHAWEEIANGWMAFALSDGNTDHVVYPTKRDAISHQSDEFRYAYVCLRNCAGGMPMKDCQLWLDMHRQMYQNGLRLTDPDMSPIVPVERGKVPWFMN